MIAVMEKMIGSTTHGYNLQILSESQRGIGCCFKATLLVLFASFIEKTTNDKNSNKSILNLVHNIFEKTYNKKTSGISPYTIISPAKGPVIQRKDKTPQIKTSELAVDI